MTRRTKIVATLGPASGTEAGINQLVDAGVDVFRFNLSHGTVEEHISRLEMVRAASRRAGRAVGVLADLPGPKIRAGEFPDGGVRLEAGRQVGLIEGSRHSDELTIQVDYPNLIEAIEIDDRIVIGDGAVSLRVIDKRGARATAVIVTGGSMQGRPGVHLSSERTHLATPTERDLELAERVASAGVDFIAVSFVRDGADVDKVRAVVGDRASLVAKIETSVAVEHLDEFLTTADAIMVARGDLGIDCPIEDVPHLQKAIVRRCVAYGVPVLTATQMLESMVTAPSPTRAEVTDVANAVFDGTDALMLSGETAIGADPVAAVETMSVVAERAESAASYRRWAERLGRAQRSQWDSTSDRVTAALCHAASDATVDVEATAILCCTQTGRTATAMARFRPGAKLLALSPNPATLGRLTLAWGVEPISLDTYTSTDEVVWHAVERAQEAGRIERGDTVVVLAGWPHRNTRTAADVLRIVQLD